LLLLLVPACATFTPVVPEQGSRDFVRPLSFVDGDVFCSGVVLAPGLVLTAAHCVVANPEPALRPGGATGQVIARGEGKVDLALLKFPAAEAPCPCVPLAYSEGRVDEAVYVVGYPYGIAKVVTVGTAQGVHEATVAGAFGMPQYLGRRLVITAAASPGNSGGGVFAFRNGEFQLVGILVEGTANLSFAIPLVDIEALLADAQVAVLELTPK
jgi:S1-C subfamily serine protease